MFDFIKVFSSEDRMSALMIAGLFYLIYLANKRNDKLVDKIEEIRLEAEENKNLLLSSIQETKACVLKFIYTEIRADRRKRDVHVPDDRRKD